MDLEPSSKPAVAADQALILAVETSSRVGSAALARGPLLLEELRFSAPMQHSSELFPVLDTLLKNHHCVPADLDQAYIAIGPGSFTGLRIAVTLAKTMHLANGVQIVTVDSLDVVAANLADMADDGVGDRGHRAVVPDRIAALFDAKRGQFYAGIYQRLRPPADASPGDQDDQDPGYRIPGPDNSLWQKVTPDLLMTAREIVTDFAGTALLGLLGDGLLHHRDEFPPDRTILLPQSCWSPRAANVHRLGYQKALAGRFAEPLGLTPFYLRGPEVTVRKNP